MVDSIYKNNLNREFRKGENLPQISTQLDSVRAYQFEVRIEGLPTEYQGEIEGLTLAAKQVGTVGGSVEDIVIERVNDKVYYPGKITYEELSITFDNLYLQRTSPALWEWFKTVYDPLTGDKTKLSRPGGSGNQSFKALKLTVIELDNTKTPHAYVEFYGVYPKGVTFSEKNYTTNEFSTLEVKFRYDYMDYGKY